MEDCKIIRSARRSFSLQMREEGLVVRAPYGATEEQIAQLLRRHAAWIEAQREKLTRAREAVPEPLSRGELEELARRAQAVIPARVAHFAPLVGVDYGRITIRSQRTRWGSCSAAGNLNFNCLLMLAPPEVLDGVVVHELCHRKQMNHSGRFYAELLRVLPDYPQRRRWLKTNGPLLLARLRPEAAPPAAPICPQRRSLAATCAPTPRSPA